MTAQIQPVASSSNAGDCAVPARRLGGADATALVVGVVIGTGVFLKAAPMAQAAGSVAWVLAAWLFAGVLSLCGSLTYAELSTRFPRAGGEYVFLKEAYGPFIAYLYTWTRFWIASPGSIAAYGVAVVHFLDPRLVWVHSHPTAVSIALIALLTGVNLLQVRVGSTLQVVITTIKYLVLLGLGIGLLFFGQGSLSALVSSTPSSASAATAGPLGFPGWSAFGIATLAALWAFDGWCNVAMVSGEIRKPQRNLPLALGLGLFSVFIIYVLVNISFFWVLPWDQVVTAQSSAFPQAESVATRAARMLFGPSTTQVLSVAMVISALGAMNGSILTSARVPFAAAQDGAFFKTFAKLSPHSRVPIRALLAQGAISCALAASGTFDQLTDLVVFASWIFYGLCAGSIFIWRRKDLTSKRDQASSSTSPNGDIASQESYRMKGFPAIPILFLVCTAFLLVNTLLSQWKESMLGLVFIALGAPFYRLLVHRPKKTT